MLDFVVLQLSTSPDTPERPVKFDDPLGARSLVKSVNILSDDSQSPAFATKFSLSFGDGEMSWVRLLGGHELPTVVVEFPYQRGVSSERLGAGQVGSTEITILRQC